MASAALARSLNERFIMRTRSAATEKHTSKRSMSSGRSDSRRLSGSSNMSGYNAQGGLRYGLTPQRAAIMQSMPQSFTVSGFNQTAKTDPGKAFDMLRQGGQPLMTAVMQANGWTQEQLNQFINQQAFNAPSAYGSLESLRGS